MVLTLLFLKNDIYQTFTISKNIHLFDKKLKAILNLRFD